MGYIDFINYRDFIDYFNLHIIDFIAILILSTILVTLIIL